MLSLDYINAKYFKLVNPAADVTSELDISTRCHICGDSKKDKNKKRLHLFTKPSWNHDTVHCFNCLTTLSPWNYFKEYHPSIFPQYRNEIQQLKLNSLALNEIFTEEKDLESSFNVSSFIKPTPQELFDLPESLIPLTKEALEYLDKRKVEPEDTWMFSNSVIRIGDIELHLKNHIIIPFLYSNKLYGFQAVCINKKQYFIYLPKENYGFKLWNFYNVPLDETVFFFESVFDAKSSGLENIISILGISIDSKIKELFKDRVFVFDNQQCDARSYEETEKLLKEGEKVMVWPKESERYKDLNDLVKAGASREKVANFIKKNIYSGMEGLIKLKLG